ncbi:MAG TPA: hypothetical protein VHS05_26225 [Pyrinomonadaceae bacterium]|jgi:hypothetical protein|nr:hypothetical protein [Pyrinomonadaceae bacterium]
MTSAALATIGHFEKDYEFRALWWAIALMALTTVHHLYGAVIYQTPWRHHAALVATGTVLVSVASFRIHRSMASQRTGQIAFWIFVILSMLIAVLGVGLFEGGYNHTLKNILYFTTHDAALMQRLFPPPTYEMPNDAFFEITGVLQFPLGLVTGWELIKTIGTHFRE